MLFFKLVCDISDYDYDFELLDDESDCEFITPWYSVVTDIFALLTIAVSGFWAGKIIAGFFINTVKIFIM